MYIYNSCLSKRFIVHSLTKCGKNYSKKYLGWNNCLSSSFQDRNGGLSSWTVWGNCTKPCGSGTSTRTRACDNPTKEGFGADCVGERSQSKPCNTQVCPTTTTQAPTTQPPTTSTTRPTIVTGNYGITYCSHAA